MNSGLQRSIGADEKATTARVREGGKWRDLEWTAVEIHAMLFEGFQISRNKDEKSLKGDSMRRELLLLMRVVLPILLALIPITSQTTYAQDTQHQTAIPQSIQEKMQRLHAMVEQLQQQNVDLQPVGDVMQGFQPLVQEQKFSEAEALVDRALKIAAELASHVAPQTGPPLSLQQKMQRLQGLVNQREQAAGDMQPIGYLMQDFQALMDQQKFSEAEALVDRALKLLGESEPAGEASTEPGDNALIAYGARDADGRQQIFVVRTDGSAKRRLTQEGDQNYLPAWSPDGRKIAFTSNRSGSSQIWEMAADGSNPIQLTTDADNSVPTWSPDGKMVAFSSKRTGHSEIWVMKADGSGQKQLTKTDVAIANDGAAWAPDGRRIAFYSNRSGHYAVWLMDPDGSHLTQFTTVESDRFADSNAPAWSPDGTKIAFWWGEAHKSGNIWVMNVDGSNRRQLTDQPVGINADGPAWSPDGKKILFSSNRPGSEGIGNWIMNADGTDQKVFTTNTFVRARPSWQPNSTTLSSVGSSASANGASSSDAGENKYGLIALTFKDDAGKLQIFTIRPDGSQKKQLTFEGDNGRPEWSPDGTKIIFAAIRDGKASVGVMVADGSSQKLLTDGRSPSWSKDGKRIAFARMDGQIWVMNADGSNILQITHSDTFKSGPNWSPDGKQMIFILLKNPGSKTDPQPQIGIMNSDGTNQRILTAEDRSNVCKEPDGHEDFLATAHDANAPNWSPVDNRIAMWSGIEKHYGEIWVINSDGTGSVQLTKECSRRNNDDPSWSQDGKKILFSTGRSGRNELWVIDSDGRNEKRISKIDADPFPGRASWQPLH